MAPSHLMTTDCESNEESGFDEEWLPPRQRDSSPPQQDNLKSAQGNETNNPQRRDTGLHRTQVVGVMKIQPVADHNQSGKNANARDRNPEDVKACRTSVPRPRHHLRILPEHTELLQVVIGPIR
jgi:hypothetical protein